MVALSLQTLAVGALGGATALTALLYRATRESVSDADWTLWTLAPLLVATPLLGVGTLAVQSPRPSSVVVGGVEVTASTAHVLGRWSLVLALSLCTVTSCWLLGRLVVASAREVKRDVWWW